MIINHRKVHLVVGGCWMFGLKVVLAVRQKFRMF